MEKQKCMKWKIKNALNTTPLPSLGEKTQSSFFFFWQHSSRNFCTYMSILNTPPHTNGFLLYILFCQYILDVFPHQQI